MLFRHTVTLNKHFNLFFLSLVNESFTTETVEFTGYDVPLLDVIPTEQLSDREFSDLVTDNDVTNAVFMMYDDSAHESFLLAV
ncbi:hypothetical protein [Enterobacter chuandaensis]|uniref:hypothetical protein n=1 Tax=Enterobacter chuandaensis TaxID=2497875 RepID=UPI002AFE7EE6|nr:hypothetical protein [Enterobacter chuandaensis]